MMTGTRSRLTRDSERLAWTARVHVSLFSTNIDVVPISKMCKMDRGTSEDARQKEPRARVLVWMKRSIVVAIL